MKYLFSVVALLLITNVGFAQGVNYKKVGAPMPTFFVDKTAGGSYNSTQLKKGKPVMIMIFSPECDHCEHMIDSLKQNEALFKTTQVVLVAEDRNKKYMPDFAKKLNLLQDPLFKDVGTNKGELIFAIYTQKILPQITFYDSRHKLVKIFDGIYTLNDIKKYIK